MNDWQEYLTRKWILVNQIDYPPSLPITGLSEWLSSNRMIEEYKYYENFLQFSSLISESDITSINITLEKFTVFLSQLCFDNGVDYIWFDKFLVVLVSFYVFNDNCNEWSLTATSRITKFIGIDSSITNSNKRLRFNIIQLFESLGTNIKFELFLGRISYVDDEFAWFVLKYSLVVNYAYRITSYFALSHKARSISMIIGKINVGSAPRDGWFIAIDARIFDLTRCLYINKDVSSVPTCIKFFGDDVVADVVSNNRYTSGVWIENRQIIRGSFSQFSDGFLSQGTVSGYLIVRCLNFLNSTKHSILWPMCDSVVAALKTPSNLSLYLSTTTNNIEIYNVNKQALFLVLESELSILKKFNIHFFFSHLIDNRGRIYVSNIPINYQLERLTRSLVDLEYSNTSAIYKEFFKKFKFESKWEKDLIFYNQLISKETIEKINEILDVDLSFFCNFSFVVNNLDDFVFSESLLTVLYRLGSHQSINERVLSGCCIFIKIKERSVDACLELLSPSPKKIPETIRLILEIKKWKLREKKVPSLTWYNDASANVIQLIIFKLFISNNKILEISNIFNNNTEFKDIYDFVAKHLTNLNKSWSCFISRDLVKRKIMPGTYGQTHFRFLKESEEILKDNTDWKELSKENKNKFLTEISFEIWKILESEELNLREFLNLCKHLPSEFPDKCRWMGKNQLPVIIEKCKVKRTSYRNSIKTILNSNDSEESIKQKLKRLDSKMNKTDKEYVRKSIHINEYSIDIKLRFLRRSSETDTRSLASSISASSNHSDDAYILFNTVLKLSDLRIFHTVIHDSIGSRLEFSSIIKYVFKLNNLEFIENLLSNDEFPFNILNLKFKKKKEDDLRIKFNNTRMQNKEKLIADFKNFSQKLINSINFFN